MQPEEVITVRRLKRWLSPLRHTPLHPQWLILRWTENASRLIKQTVHGVVLDIGCGDRWVEHSLPPNSRYLGLDYLPTVSKGYTGQPDVFGDGQRLPFVPESVDSVVLMDVMEHLPMPEMAMKEVWRVLKPGGVMLMQTPFLYPLHDEPHDFQRWTLHGLTTLFESNHFEIHQITLHGHPLETSAALLAIALANSVLEAVKKKHFSILLTPLFVAAIPLVNLSGWALAKSFPASAIMPLSYRVVAHKSRYKLNS